MKRKICSCRHTCPASGTCSSGKFCTIRDVYLIARKHEYCDKLLDEIACYGFVLIKLHGLNTYFTISNNDSTHRELQVEKMKYAEILDNYLIQKKTDKNNINKPHGEVLTQIKEYSDDIIKGVTHYA